MPSSARCRAWALIAVITVIGMVSKNSCQSECNKMGQFLISKQAVNIKTGSGVTASQDKTSIEIRSQFTDSHDWYCSNGIFSWNLKNVTDTNLKINEACSKCSCFVNETGISDSGLRAEYFAYNLTLTLDYPNLIICASYGPPCQQHNVTVRDIKLKNMTSLVILSALRNFPVAALPTMQLLMSDDNHLYFYHLDAQIAFGPSSNSTDLFQYMGKKIPFRSELQSHMREHCASHCRRSEHPNTSPETDTSVELLRYSMDTNLEAETSSEQSTTITTTATATTTTTTTTTHPHTTKAGGDGDEENGSPDRFFACLPLLLFVSVFMLVALNGFCNKRRLCFCRNKKHSKEQDQRDNMRRLIQAASHVPCYQDDGQNFSGHRIRYYLPVPLSFFNNTASDQISALDTLSPYYLVTKGGMLKSFSCSQLFQQKQEATIHVRQRMFRKRGSRISLTSIESLHIPEFLSPATAPAVRPADVRIDLDAAAVVSSVLEIGRSGRI